MPPPPPPPPPPKKESLTTQSLPTDEVSILTTQSPSTNENKEILTQEEKDELAHEIVHDIFIHARKLAQEIMEEQIKVSLEHHIGAQIIKKLEEESKKE